jgi:hypothetical protein
LGCQIPPLAICFEFCVNFFLTWQLTQGLKLVNHNLITNEETQYIYSCVPSAHPKLSAPLSEQINHVTHTALCPALMHRRVLDLLAWNGSERKLVRDVDLHMFSVVAALSERVVSLEPWVRRCIADLDVAALQHKLGRAKALFYCNDPDCTVRVKCCSRVPVGRPGCVAERSKMCL